MLTEVLSKFEGYVLLAGILSLLPIFIPADYNLQNSLLEDSIISDASRLIFAATSGFSIPLCTYFLMEYTCPIAVKIALPRFVLICCLAIPPIILICATASRSAMDYYQPGILYVVLTTMQRIFAYGISFSMLQRYLSGSLPTLAMGGLIALLLLIEACDVSGLATGLISLRQLAVALYYIFSIIPIVSLVAYIGYGIYDTIEIQRPVKYFFLSMPDTERLAVSMAVLVVLHIIGQLAVTSPLYIEDFSAANIIPSYLLTSIFIVIVLLVPSRLVLGKVFQLEKELEQRRVFVRHISHEIRTPLNTVSVGLSLLESKLKSIHEFTALEISRDAQQACSTAVNILTGILDYEKLGASVMTIEQEWVRPLRYLQDIIKPFLMQAKLKKLTVNFGPAQYSEINNPVYKVHIDRQKMGQVIRNFISNALKFSPEGSAIDIWARVKRGTGGTALRLEFIDRGPGISDANQRKVFNDIVQFNANELQGGGGSGIGLWVSKKIVDLHGGRVGLISKEGQGCTFFLELALIEEARAGSLNNEVSSRERPLSRLSMSIFQHSHRQSSAVFPTTSDQPTGVSISEKLARGPSLRGAGGPSQRGIGAHQLRILVTDDSAMNRKMMARLVNSVGHSSVEAGDGQQCLDMYVASIEENKPFDVVLLDRHMPVMCGKTASSTLRSMGYQGVIIGVTGDAIPADIDEFIANGANAVLVKPIQPADLDRTLKALLKANAWTSPGDNIHSSNITAIRAHDVASASRLST